MYKYILLRILALIPVLLGVSFIVFTIMYLSSGDAATIILGENASEEALRELRAQLGLDRPFVVQYLSYIYHAFLRFDLGRSFITNRVILDEILLRLPNTLKLASLSVLASGIFGILLGVMTSTKPNSKADKIGQTISLISVSMPTFWLALLLIILFSATLRILPASGFSNLNQMILPVLALSFSSAGVIARITRANMVEVLELDYIKTARAKGLGNHQVIYGHALKNALIPVVTVIGLQFGTLVGGAVLTESIFSINGLGLLLVNAIRQRDSMMVLGGVLVIAVLFCIVNLIVDIIYAYLDPKVKMQYQR